MALGCNKIKTPAPNNENLICINEYLICIRAIMIYEGTQLCDQQRGTVPSFGPIQRILFRVASSRRYARSSARAHKLARISATK